MAFDSMAQSAAVYVRISKDSDETGLGVERQRKACEEMAQRRGWIVGEVYEDNDISAFSGKHRPGYTQMLEDIRAGKRDAIVVYVSSRVTRTMRDLEDLIELHNATKFLFATTEGDLDLGTSQGRTLVRVLGVFNTNYSESNQAALKAKHVELAEAGKVSGQQRVYGYDVDVVKDSTPKGWHFKRVINEGEAKVIREVVAEIIEVGKGYNLTAKCKDLNARGDRTAAGREFVIQSLRKFLTAWRIAGIRDHKGVPMGKGAKWVDGELVGETAAWKAIISEDDLKTVRSILLDPERTTYTGAPRKYLLSNLLECGKCGGIMQFGTSTKKATETRPAARWDSYRCKSCSSTIGMEVTDTTIINTVARMIGLPSSSMGVFIDGEPTGVKAMRIKRSEVLEEIASVHEMGLRPSTAGPMLKSLDAELDGLDAEITKYLHRDALRGLVACLSPLDRHALIKSTIDNRQAVREAFAGMTLAQKRAVVTALMSLTIAPSIKGKVKRSDAIARIRITELDPATGEPFAEDESAA